MMLSRRKLGPYNSDGSYRIGIDLIEAGVTTNIKDINWILNGVRAGEVYEIYSESVRYLGKLEANVRDANGEKLDVVNFDSFTPVRLAVPAGGVELRTFLASYDGATCKKYIKRIA